MRPSFKQDSLLYNERFAEEVARNPGTVSQAHLLIGLDSARHPAMNHDVPPAQLALYRGLRADEKRPFDPQVARDSAFNTKIPVYLELALESNTCLE